ncbi:hypothetical protein AKO1_008944 [Acrasis kona]|uniref:Divalent-cation tolerance protein CutA n=1 Tax=Acrasis kona TaxID=1008807 RepID=A0AAW2ZFK5_9EUKA
MKLVTKLRLVNGRSMSKHFVCLVTIETSKSEQLAEKLVESRKCACVNIIPKVKSVYWWEGKIEKSDESLLIVKTNEQAKDDLTSIIKKNHPYDVPEIVFSEISSGNEDYMKWIDDSIL